MIPILYRSSTSRSYILLRSDTNTKGCLHWFSFSVKAKEPCTMTFSILNNKRHGQLYTEGKDTHRGCRVTCGAISDADFQLKNANRMPEKSIYTILATKGSKVK